ncbi:lipoprotein-releasing system permease protein [Verrucomicrobium sp. GAS474]|uniref:FtsX-like permease family protein n=1 Tax=Verrucomicrobium sp. GAS474 TaxID=1882831 RepID=UPI00087A115A|nr:FtsX-like permease family protein [Verrucomicrobium sp. GAS474]SDU24337.1 lipoprotein-releasing system permease protein [Verrucomicrobium sp. GAS474]
MKPILELSVALRYLRPRRTFVSAITVLSVLGVTLAVAVLIIVLSVMAGFERELQNKIIGFNAHLVVTSGGIVEKYPDLLAKLEKEPEVLGAAPYVTGPIFTIFQGHTNAPMLRGIDPVAEERVLPLKKYLVAGEFELRGDSVLVGREWAWRNQAFVGDKVTVYGPRQLQGMTKTSAKGGKPQEVVLPSELIITGIFETGLYEYDLNFLLTSLETAQYLYNLPDGSVHGIALRVPDPLRAGPVRDRINDHFPAPIHARTWSDMNRTLFTAIATEKTVMAFILFFIMIVAAFGLCSTLITITVQKAREIGLLKAIGARDGQILGIFVVHGLVVGCLGAVLGVAMAAVALYYRNPFRDFMGRRLGIDLFPPEVYNFSSLPAEVSFGQVGAIAGAAVVICMVAALIPALAAARLDPVEALRHE